jgi:hypothetical protein
MDERDQSHSSIFPLGNCKTGRSRQAEHMIYCCQNIIELPPGEAGEK